MYSDNNFYGDTSYLDLFLQDCMRNKDAHNALIKEKNQQGQLTIAICLICILAIFVCGIIKTEIFPIIFGVVFFLMFAVIIACIPIAMKKYKLKEDIYNGGDGIDYGNVDCFLASNQMAAFDDFGQSFCVNNKSICEKKNTNIFSFVIFFVLWILCLCATFCLLSINDIDVKQESLVGYVTGISFFAAISIGVFVGAMLPIIKKYIICNHKINAACVAVYSKRSGNSGNKTTVYRPFYYIKYDGLGYVLCPKTWSNINVPAVGDLKEKFFINPQNPFEYRTSGEWKDLLFLFIVAAVFMIPFVLGLVNILH